MILVLLINSFKLNGQGHSLFSESVSASENRGFVILLYATFPFYNVN